MQKIQTITSKGQITLPVAWRRKVGARHIMLETTGDRIEIMPARLSKKTSDERIIFDALRHNNGKGIETRTLRDLVETIDSRRRHTEVRWGDPHGKEVW